MNPKTIRSAALAAALAIVPLAPAFADRDATAEEKAIIADVLSAEGFTSWGDIEFDDDGMFEVDNALDQDGNKRDLKLDQAFAIVDADEDDDGIVGTRLGAD